MKFIRRLGLQFCIFALATLVFTTVAYGAVYGATVSRSYDGITFTSRTSCASFGNSIKGTVTTAASTSRPAGYLGADCWVVRNDGFVAGTATRYSQSATSSFSTNATASGSSGRSYQTTGTSYVYLTSTGNYMSIRANPSPFLSINSLSSQNQSAVQDGITIDGQRYGSLQSYLYEGDNLDLIAAVGINGMEGYIRVEDFLAIPRPSNPEDAVSSFASEREVQIPVYDIDGNVIDSYCVVVGGI
ncbi:hypothetical protein [Enorma phocaeensis]|uniref:hypothetical protein n=1 Tax=Enorma phocaeensis TaxID=1871019 RepID=UPI003207F705